MMLQSDALMLIMLQPTDDRCATYTERLLRLNIYSFDPYLENLVARLKNCPSQPNSTGSNESYVLEKINILSSRKKTTYLCYCSRQLEESLRALGNLDFHCFTMVLY